MYQSSEETMTMIAMKKNLAAMITMSNMMKKMR